jgi:serine/threonine protein kinase/predicted Zn-dependent protease
MTTPGESSVQRLTRALECYLRHRHDPAEDRAQFLARHDDLRDLLEPMFDEAPADPAGDAMAGGAERQFGPFRLLGEIARGGMGVVYDALHTGLNRRVALKLLASPLAASPHAVARLRREAELTARLNHPHIVPIHDAGMVDGVPFHAMERVDGGTLADLLRAIGTADRAALDGDTLAAAHARTRPTAEAGRWLRGTSHIDVVLRIALAIADALAAAHAAGILHRDVKPANVLLRSDGTPLLSDFGLARDEREPGLSRSGEFVGTPFYVAPEQAAGDRARIGPHTDVFALAVVVYEMLFLERPFDGDSSEAVLARVRLAEPAALLRRDHGLPADLAAVLDKALRKDPAARYPTMAAFAAELRAVRELRPVQARRRGRLLHAWQRWSAEPRRLVAAGVVLVALAVGGGSLAYVFGQRDRIAAGAELELLPRVEALLLRVALQQEHGVADMGLADALAAHAMLPDLPETVAAVARTAALAGDAATARSYAERLAGLAPDVAAQVAHGSAAPEPSSALGWLLRARWLLDRAHVSGSMATYREARDCLRRAIDRSTRVREIYYCEQLHSLSHVQDRVALVALADDLLHRWPASPFVAFWCGVAFENLDPRRAIAELQRAVAGIPDLPQPLVRLARAHENARQWRAAIELHERVLATWPREIGARAGRARCLARMGRAEAALAALDELLADQASYYWLHADRGEVLRGLGRTDEALVAYERAAALGPEAALPWNARAELLLAQGRAAEALVAAERACALEPGNTRAHSNRGIALLHAERPAEASQALQRVVGDWPWGDQNWRALAQAYRRDQRLEAAVAAIDKALAIAPDDPLHLAELGKLQRARGDRTGAQATFTRVLQAVPDDYEALVNLAGLGWEQGQRDEAVRLLARARAVDPEKPHAWAPSIQYLERMERWRDAVGVRAEFCAARPRDRKARIELVDKVLGLPAEPGDAALLARLFAELQSLDGGDRDDVAERRRQAADRLESR